MKKVYAVILFICLLQVCFGQAGYRPDPENQRNREWFEAARFGVFIHWGVYSLLGDGEWVMEQQNLGLAEYGLLPGFFNPVGFNAKEWAKLFKSAGARYITFTSRHHDGFSMWNSRASDYNIVKATPFRRDVVKELVDACRAEGLKVMFYYSLLDWKRDDYLPSGRTGKGIAGRDEKKGNWDAYIQFMKSQLTELLTDYGRIDGIWFDGHWDKPSADWRYDEIYSLIHKLQPHCLIGNNHHLAPFAGEDFQMFERDLPGHNTTGFGTAAEHVGELPKEVCGTIAGSWGFDIKDRQRKSFKEILSYLVKAAGYGSNLLLNVGPMPSGKIPDYQQERLVQLGEWLKIYGETVYGTEAGPVMPTDEYAMTKKGNTIFLHLFRPDNGSFIIRDFPYELSSVVSFDGKTSVPYQLLDKKVLVVQLPEGLTDAHDLVLRLSIK
ncbi:alpha-L-fucosidase [Sphingobacterium allocomposti]|uniref:alpha-L-fucosidase n=1 Tax=Sphingobacterium allocomposti TaxID=415956 RepID=A0A5S5DP89_9SPHI|nr:alpha-L-fucosidase [Sphingobacterium composti Yoo et al. 2007 non Ten et al. 2007]TYP96846.1 alpha-L-fucosidase [Sphingobacterium composti Yoo et al. 2007 non Ten et al. 2007]